MSEKTRAYIIVDSLTGEIMNGKVYVHKGTAEHRLRKGGFYLPNKHRPIVLELTYETVLTLIEKSSKEEGCENG